MKGLIDTTLREGAQTLGVDFTLDQKKAIVYGLVGIGVEEIELGIASRFDEDLPLLMKYCQKMTRRASFSVWSLCREENIELAASLRPDVLALSIPVSDLHIHKKLGKNRKWVVETIQKSVAFARKRGLERIALGLEDATRADPDFLREVFAHAEKCGIFRLRIADTVGIATPWFMEKLVAGLVGSFSLEVGVHTHNDFGMATANCLAALEVGAKWADVTILGLGERAGNARLEEVSGFLALQKRRFYRTEELKALCLFVGDAAAKIVDPHHPIIGDKIFTCETGLHLQGLEKDPATYEPYSPTHVGAERRLVYGQKIGRKNLGNRLAELKISPPSDCLEKAFNMFKVQTKELGRPLQDNELLALYSM